MQLVNPAGAESLHFKAARQWLWWPYLVATVLAMLAKLPTLNNHLIFIDEGSYLVQAIKLDSLEAFIYAFQHRIETKSQYGLIPYILAYLISPENAVFYLRLFGLAATIGSACLIVAISRQLFQTYVPGFFALAVWCLYLNHNLFTAAILLETFQTPLLLVSFWLLINWLQEPNRGMTLLWIGLLLGFAILVKPIALALLPVYLGMIALYQLSWSRIFILDRLKLLLCFSLGLLLPLALFLLPYLLRPETLGELKFNLFEINASYALTFNQTQSLFVRVTNLLRWFEPVNLFLILVSLIIYLIGWRQGKRTKVDLNQCLLVLNGVLLYVGFAVGQGKPHYLIPILPFFMLFVGYRLQLGLLKLNRRGIRLAAFGLVALVIGLGEWHTLLYYAGLYSDNGQSYAQEMPDLDEAALISYIKANTTPQDYIWVFYNAPEIYWKSQRHPATNEPINAFLIDLYDDYWFERYYQELERDKPKLIIGIDHSRYTHEWVATLTELPRIKDLLAEKYNCNRNIIANTTVCRHTPT